MSKKPVKNKGGRPSIKMPCGWGCGAELGAFDMRKHLADCPKRPDRKNSTIGTTTLSAAPAGTSATIEAGALCLCGHSWKDHNTIHRPEDDPCCNMCVECQGFQDAPIVHVGPENPVAIEFERLLREGGATVVDVTPNHAPTALEHAARAEAPIGKSVTEFLLENPPKVQGDPRSIVGFARGDSEEILVVAAPVDEWQDKCLKAFGAKVMASAARSIPRWDRMSWEQRHEFLKAQQESQW